jgi:hypothetical protein
MTLPNLKMSGSKRTFYLLLLLLFLTMAGLVGGAYGINALLAKQSSKLVGLKAQDQALTQEQQSLAKAKRDIATYASLETIAKTVVPQDKDQAEAVREIVNLASSSGVSLGSITFPASSLGATPTVHNTTGVAAAGATPVAANGGNPALSQLTAVPGIPGVYSLQISVTNADANSVTYAQLESFLGKLEQNRRTAQVTALTIQPQVDDPSQLTFTLSINEYIKPS